MSTTLENKITPQYVGMRVTPASYMELEEDGFKYDMIDGVLYLSPSATSDHAESQSGIISLLGIYRQKHGGFKLYTELDIYLPDGGDVLLPDVSVVLDGRLEIVKKYIHGAPDLVVELLSDRTDKRDLGVKADRYLACGVQEYWILNPRNRTMGVWNNRGNAWSKRAGDSLESIILRDFRVEAKDVSNSSTSQ